MTKAHADRGHATLAPSSAHRFMACAGSIRMARGVEDAGSIFAAEGTAAHQLAEMCIRGHFDAERFAGETIFVKQQKFPVTPEMVEAVQIYLDVAYALEQESDEFESEQHLDMNELVDGVHGTGDIIAYSEAARRVTIADLKYGKGVAVEVEDNEQLLTYAMGVAQRYHNRGIEEVELVIVQPRAPHPDGPVRRWITDVIGLYEHVAALQRAAVAVGDPKAPLVVGDHCKFCRAAGFCGALENRVGDIVHAQVRKGVLVGTEQPEARPLKDWPTEQSELNLVAQWLKGREAFAHNEAVAGRPPPGAKLVAKKTHRKWVNEDEAGKKLLAAGVDLDDLYEPPALKSPAVVEKLLPAKVRAATMKDLAKNPPGGGTVIAPLSDPRPPVDASAAAGFEAVEIADR